MAPNLVPPEREMSRGLGHGQRRYSLPTTGTRTNTLDGIDLHVNSHYNAALGFSLQANLAAVCMEKDEPDPSANRTPPSAVSSPHTSGFERISWLKVELHVKNPGPAMPHRRVSLQVANDSIISYSNIEYIVTSAARYNINHYPGHHALCACGAGPAYPDAQRSFKHAHVLPVAGIRLAGGIGDSQKLSMLMKVE
ncbi:hypothetical protein L209DRAFT_743172 [Thermothelomyces heterothallicus CBS 203.75]